MPAEATRKGLFDISSAMLDSAFQRLPDGRSFYHPWGIFNRSGYALTPDQRAAVEAYLRRSNRWVFPFAIVGWSVIPSVLSWFMPSGLAFGFVALAGAAVLTIYWLRLRRLLADAERCDIASPARQSVRRFVAALNRRDIAVLGAVVAVPALLVLAPLQLAAGPWFVVAGGLASFVVVGVALVVYYRPGRRGDGPHPPAPSPNNGRGGA